MNTVKTFIHAAVRSFRKKIYDYYRKHGKKLPWRNTRNPYRILVSEAILRQMQVEWAGKNIAFQAPIW